ncbi:hypothetical protein DDB_G0274835 [Dictyostelium discoideum AX4]|uniref:Uncharacterized protein n=1 Tax=Dictyostelium discoideum TaxID=44689 RepID=Q555R0_DICDI|nr:hypothetical protein DDB_G0274835 [Dictyostelium discoideum AX4]EAL70310.1 hypothetical protein DDB_G0274835 [Dictyostelium discoideum AX4]|eukprot:XP_644003.1 hypothetical protein DDB_G0274835 [Dictyostelium discoideum AX4]
MNVDDIYADIIIESENDQENDMKQSDENSQSPTLKEDHHNKIKEFEEIIENNLKEISNLKKEIESKDNEIETLSKQTSLLEIQRKEKEINSLRDELSNSNKKVQSSNPANNRQHINYEMPKK